ncbi:MAG: formate dehydrogenase subunit gamma [Bryobacterales bacterium]
MSRSLARFSFAERAAHWMAAISFIYAALTGLSLWSTHLYWLAAVLGGGPTVRWGHPWGGIVFAVVLGFIFLNWAGQMRLDADDRKWLAESHKYAMNEEEGLPEPGRFNAGQKMLFWVQSACTLLLFASGFVLWWPAQMPRTLLSAAVLIHPATAIVAIAGILVHVYMGLLVVPGALHGMVRGEVSRGWAAAHHPKWLRETSKR